MISPLYLCGRTINEKYAAKKIELRHYVPPECKLEVNQDGIQVSKNLNFGLDKE